MTKTLKPAPAIFLTIFSFICQVALSQPRVKGRILNMRDRQGVAYATISTGKGGASTYSDMQGNFILSLHDVVNNDSLSISSVGFKSMRIALADAIKTKEFILSEQATELKAVEIKSFINQGSVGTVSNIGYFRSWDQDRHGGEVGKIFYIDKGVDIYKLESILFKVSNMCDTCSIRLHIRDVDNGWPGQELLTDSLAVEINKLTFDDQSSKFNLQPYEMIMKRKALFIGLELLNCSKGLTPCSFNFVGIDKGEYYYKLRTGSNWEMSSGFGMNIKMYYLY